MYFSVVLINGAFTFQVFPEIIYGITFPSKMSDKKLWLIVVESVRFWVKLNVKVNVE